MAQHSPGPWIFRRDWFVPEYDPPEYPVDYQSRGYAYNPAIVDANGERVVGCDEYNVFSGDNQAANVRLLLAAPELLEALEEFITSYIHDVEAGDWGNWNPEEEDRVIKARCAIKKARGEQP